MLSSANSVSAQGLAEARHDAAAFAKPWRCIPVDEGKCREIKAGTAPALPGRICVDPNVNKEMRASRAMWSAVPLPPLPSLHFPGPSGTFPATCTQGLPPRGSGRGT